MNMCCCHVNIQIQHFLRTFVIKFRLTLIIAGQLKLQFFGVISVIVYCIVFFAKIRQLFYRTPHKQTMPPNTASFTSINQSA